MVSRVSHLPPILTHELVGKKASGSFMKGTERANLEAPLSAGPGDDLSVSTLGMEGWEEDHEELTPTAAGQ
jgi:hypothetical protein